MNEKQVLAMKRWVKALEAAAKKRLKSRIVELYKENEESTWDWAKVDDATRAKYDAMVIKANKVLF